MKTLQQTSRTALAAVVVVVAVVFLDVAVGAAAVVDEDETRGELELRMPNSKPTVPETYFCTSFKLDSEETIYITGFEPLADKKTAHHMIVFGCKSPGKPDPVFHCGAMDAAQDQNTAATNPCSNGTSIVYAWAQNAPKLHLPKDVAFRVGGEGSKIDYLVLQVHYASVDYVPEEGDTSGVKIHYTNKPKPKSAGVYMTATFGRFPARKTTKSEAACTLETDLTLHPFAFRVHTHALGRVVTGWKVSPDMQWTLLGKDDPQLPQMFNPVTDKSTTLTGGDTVATRCTMVNDGENEVTVGQTRKDEMCNFYVMFWVDGDRLPENTFCFTPGPPIYAWNSGSPFVRPLKNIPDKDASSYDEE